MEKLLIKPYDKEFMRMAMLKHEQTFREQVYELHRLYRMQKILMKNMESMNVSIQQHSGMTFDLEQPAGDKDYKLNRGESKGVLEKIDESEIHLTLGPTNYRNSPRKKLSDTSRNSDDYSAPSFSSSSTGSSQINKIVNHEEQQQERLKHPPWLLQVLSLNMT